MKALLLNKVFISAGLSIIIVGFLIRIYNLTIIPVFVDEAIYVRWAQIMRAEQSLRFIPLSDGKQPLYMWGVIPFLKIFSDPLFAGRFVSVLTGMGTLLGVGVLTYILFKSKRGALVAMFLYALSPFAVFFDRLALADSMLSFLGVWTSIFAILTVKYQRLDTAMITGFMLGGALITKSPGIYFALLIPAALIFSTWGGNFKQKFTKSSVYIFLFSAIYLIAFAIYNILRLGPNFHMISIRNKDYVYPISHFFSSPLDPLRPFLDRSLEYFNILGPFTLTILFAAGVLMVFKKYVKEVLFLLAWLLIPIFISSEFSKTMTARYIYFSVPYFIVLAASGFAMIYSKYKIKSLLNPGKVLLVILSLFAITALYQDAKLLTNPEYANLPRSERSGYLEEWTAGHGIKEISGYIKDLAKEDQNKKGIVVGTEGHFGTLPDGLLIYLNNIPGVTVIGVGQPIRELSNSLRDSKDFGNYTFLVVNDTRLLVDPQGVGLKLVNSYPKAARPDGSIENLLLFEVQ